MPSQPICRINDIGIGICPCHLGIPIVAKIITGSPNTLAGNLGKAQMNGLMISSCGHIATIKTGNPTVLVNNIPQSRIGDLFMGTNGCPIGTLTIGLPNVLG